MSLPEKKKAIRAALLRQRAELTPERLETFGCRAQTRLLELEAFRSAQVIALYSPIRNEVPTDLLLDAALNAGKLVSFPCVVGEALHFFRVAAREDLRVGSFGVYEPSPDGSEIRPERIGLLLVPGVAFDRCGHRLGYGRGYFDRLFAGGMVNGLRVGFGFDFQLVDRLPVESHDQTLDLLVTDKEVFSPS